MPARAWLRPLARGVGVLVRALAAHVGSDRASARQAILERWDGYGQRGADERPRPRRP